MTTQTRNKINRLTSLSRRNGWTVEQGVDAPLPSAYCPRDREWVEIGCTDSGDDRMFVIVQHGVTAAVVIGGTRRFTSLADLIRRAESGRVDGTDL